MVFADVDGDGVPQGSITGPIFLVKNAFYYPNYEIKQLLYKF
jgi:hypothetical protein